jgi:Lon-like protease
VAVTGTIRPDGSVGPVGGVAQKIQAVKAAGAEIFLVPTAEFEEAKARAGRNLRVEAVGTLDDALRILASFGGNGLALAAPGTPGT